MSRKRTGSVLCECGAVHVEGPHRVLVTLPDGRRPTIGTYATWAEADDVRRATLEEMGSLTGEDFTMLKDFGGKWLDDREKDRVLRRPEGYRSSWDCYVVPHPIANMAIRAIRPSDLDELVTSMRTKGLARQTIRNALTVVRGVIRAAMRKGLVKLDPFAAGVAIPKDRRTEEAWTYAIPSEQEAILNACTGPIRHMVAFAMATGLRAGELVALRLEDVHEDRIVVRYGSPGEPTKSGKIRVVYMNGKAREAMIAASAAISGYTATKKRPEGYNPLGLLFPGQRGCHRSQAHVIKWKEWQAVLKRAGIKRTFRWHDLRHTCASSLVSGWWGRRWSLEEVREVLGHSTIAVTQRYAHLASDAMASAAAETVGSIESIANRSPVQSTTLEVAENQSRLRDLNSRPTVYETVALPLS